MANHQYTSDILADALFRAGEETDGSSDYASQALVYLNSVYFQICRGGSELTPSVNEDWAWLMKPTPGTLTLKPALSGTCDVTQNSTGVTLDAAQAVSMATYYFKIDSHPDIFRVSAHTAATTSVTLDSVYTGETVEGADYTAFILEYDLASDVMRLVAPLRVYATSDGGRQHKIDRVAPDQVDLWAEDLSMVGIPDKFAEVGTVTTGVKRVRFNRYISPDDTKYVRVDYDYLFRPTGLTSPGTSEEPVLPLEWRHVLSDYLLSYLYSIKNDDRAGPSGQMAQAGLRGMAAENRYRMVTAGRGLYRILPRQGHVNYRTLRHASWGSY